MDTDQVKEILFRIRSLCWERAQHAERIKDVLDKAPDEQGNKLATKLYKESHALGNILNNLSWDVENLAKDVYCSSCNGDGCDECKGTGLKHYFLVCADKEEETTETTTPSA